MPRRKYANTPFALRTGVPRGAYGGGRIEVRFAFVLGFLPLRGGVGREEDVRVGRGDRQVVMFVDFGERRYAFGNGVGFDNVNGRRTVVGVEREAAADQFVQLLRVFAFYRAAVRYQ